MKAGAYGNKALTDILHAAGEVGGSRFGLGNEVDGPTGLGHARVGSDGVNKVL